MTQWMLLLSALLFLAPPAARAETAEATYLVGAEVSEGKGEPARLALSVTGEHGCASAEARSGDVAYKLDVCRDGGEAAAPVFVFDVERRVSEGRSSSRVAVKLTSRVSLGKRVVVGRVALGDGRTTEIAATVDRQ